MGVTVSAVVCTYAERRWDQVLAAVRSLRMQTAAPLEIVLAVDHNPDLLARVRRALPDVVAVPNRLARGLSGAKNSGTAAARGEIVAFLDDDAEAAPDWLEQLLAPYGPRVMGVGGRTESAWAAGRPYWFPPEFEWVVGGAYVGLPAVPAPVRNLHGGNMSLRREVLVEAGGFDPGIGRVGTLPVGGEDTELCIRLRQRRPDQELIYAPAARIRHHVPRERGRWRYFVARCYREGVSKAQVARSVGVPDGLATERAYTRRTLPAGVGRGLWEFASGRSAGGLARAGAIAAGLAVTAAGYGAGSIRPRRRPAGPAGAPPEAPASREWPPA